MTPSSEEITPVAQAEVGEWHLAVATVRGSTHDAIGAPIQDAVRWEAVSPAGSALVLALADGHGHQRHWRSDRGAQAAVDVCCRVLAEARDELEAGPDPARNALLRDRLIPTLVEGWRARVLLDVAEDPLAAAGATVVPDPVIPYGTTLIGALFAGSHLTLIQIGDGDVVVARTDGTSFQPIPGDDRLVLHYTTSLCQPDAPASFRCAVVDLESEGARWILFATDGFANAQSDADWRQRLGTDLDDLASHHGPRWPASQLGRWATRCASAEGSGDDVTVALASRQ